MHNSNDDEARHTYWNARMKQNLGAYSIKYISDIHEQYSNGPQIEKDMDLYNNKVGYNMFTYNKSRFDLELDVMDAVNRGLLHRIHPHFGIMILINADDRIR